MRIVAGKYRGKKLCEYYCGKTRPTTDRVKENIFNVLSNKINFSGLTVLDLFAGTGQYGIECLSRGAKEVVFNDLDTEAITVIKKNLIGIDGKVTILQKDYRETLQSNRKYDLIFLDPPYAAPFGEEAISIISKHNLLSPNGVIVFETDKILNYADKKVYGRTNIYFINL
jgi:16S rRNA (guanine(966)-N(2))-methyltransferase RsmD